MDNLVCRTKQLKTDEGKTMTSIKLKKQQQQQQQKEKQFKIDCKATGLTCNDSIIS